MTKHASVTESSGNVFVDLGLPDAVGELFKAELTLQISKRIKDLDLTQKQAGVRLGLSQPDVSRLMNGRRAGFSTDRLLAFLNALDLDVDIVVRPVAPPPHAARVRIIGEHPKP